MGKATADLPEDTGTNSALARDVVDDGVRRYFADRRDRVKPFVDRNFSLGGSLKLHRAAVGWDILRAPFNLTMAIPQIGLILAGQAARKLGAARIATALGGTQLTFDTAIGKELAWRLHTDLLELPYTDGDRVSAKDAPALAAMIAQQTAVMSFPLGGALGSMWYTLFPAAPSAILVAGLTGGLLAASTLVSAFAGVVADPVQRRLGLHQRRLNRMLDALERQMEDSTAPGFAVHDHYVARLLDLFDMAGAVVRAVVR